LNMVVFDGCAVSAGAGVRMSRLARQCADHGLTGCEFMATVPGDIGGGIAMNAGCFAQQVSDSLSQVEVLLRSGNIETIKATGLKMGYRHADLPAACLVLSATFRLQTAHPRSR